MKRTSFCLAAVGLACLATLSAVNAIRSADPPPGPKAQAPNPPAPFPNVPTIPGPKSTIERPTENLLAFRTAAPAADSTFVNPKVEPGKVKWHADFTTACQAAEKSGKPVLLFQMMGRLDERFC
jgi:hypothetical protein